MTDGWIHVVGVPGHYSNKNNGQYANPNPNPSPNPNRIHIPNPDLSCIYLSPIFDRETGPLMVTNVVLVLVVVLLRFVLIRFSIC